MAMSKLEDETKNPFQEIMLAGVKITVLEFTFLQEQKAVPLSIDLINDISAVFSEEYEPGFSDVENIFCAHSDTFNQLVCMAINKPVDWLASLTGPEGQLLTMTFWGVNRYFFTNRVVTKIIEQSLKKAEKLSVLQGNTTH